MCRKNGRSQAICECSEGHVKLSSSLDIEIKEERDVLDFVQKEPNL